MAGNDGSQFPGEIGDVFHAAIHSLAGKRRHEVCGIAGEQNTVLSLSTSDAHVESVDHAPFDLDRGEVDERFT